MNTAANVHCPKVVHVDKLKPCLQPTAQDTAPLPEPLTDETRVAALGNAVM